MFSFKQWKDHYITKTNLKNVLKDFLTACALLLAFLISIFLLGCDTDPKIVVKTEIKIIKTPSYLLMKCKVDAPPEKLVYLAQKPQGKEDLLSTYISTLLGNIKSCNDQITSIASFQEKEEHNILKNAEPKK